MKYLFPNLHKREGAHSSKKLRGKIFFVAIFFLRVFGTRHICVEMIEKVKIFIRIGKN